MIQADHTISSGIKKKRQTLNRHLYWMNEWLNEQTEFYLGVLQSCGLSLKRASQKSDYQVWFQI